MSTKYLAIAALACHSALGFQAPSLPALRTSDRCTIAATPQITMVAKTSRRDALLVAAAASVGALVKPANAENPKAACTFQSCPAPSGEPIALDLLEVGCPHKLLLSTLR